MIFLLHQPINPNTQSSMIIENIDEKLIVNELHKQMKLHIENFFNGNELALKKIKSLMVKDKTKINDNWNNVEKTMILFKACFKKPDLFQQEIWRNYDRIMHGVLNTNNSVYYNNDIEIHARLNEKIYYDTNDSMIDCGYFLPKEQQEDLIKLLKPKLEKFNQLLFHHKKQLLENMKHDEKSKLKLK